MATGHFLCRISLHKWMPQRSEDGEPLALAGRPYEVCRHCGAVRERPWGGGGAVGHPG
jgi:hypothetical protein